MKKLVEKSLLDLVSYKKCATYFLRDSFFKTLFGSSFPNYHNQECFNNPNRGYENIVYSTNYPAGLEASENFFEAGKRDLETRLYNSLAMKLLTVAKFGN